MIKHSHNTNKQEQTATNDNASTGVHARETMDKSIKPNTGLPFYNNFFRTPKPLKIQDIFQLEIWGRVQREATG